MAVTVNYEPCVRGCMLTESLLHSETALVVVDDDWNPAVRAQFREPGLLLDILRDVDSLPGIVLSVRLLELLQEDGRLDAVGRGECEELDALGRLEAGWSFVRHILQSSRSCVQRGCESRMRKAGWGLY
jgi:hypothetical protein